MDKFSQFNLPNLKGQRVVVTGGLGFVGSNVARRCLELGGTVTIYDCLDPRSGGNLYNVSDIEDELQIVLNDIRSFEGISACIRSQDILINCAAFTSHPNSMKEPLIDIDVNCKGVINVLEAARRFNPDIKVVHIGTSTQIGRMQVSPADETHAEFPVDIYSANKTAAEKYVLIYGTAYGIRTTVIRLANNFGPRSNISSPEFGFMNYFVGLALQGKEITVYGEGSQLRNVSFVDDSAAAIITAAQTDKSDGQVFFAVGDRQYSVTDIATAIVENVGGTMRFVEWPKNREAIEIGDAILSNAKIKDVLGWSPRYDLAEGLLATRNYFQNCLHKYF